MDASGKCLNFLININLIFSTLKAHYNHYIEFSSKSYQWPGPNSDQLNPDSLSYSVGTDG